MRYDFDLLAAQWKNLKNKKHRTCACQEHLSLPPHTTARKWTVFLVFKPIVTKKIQEIDAVVPPRVLVQEANLIFPSTLLCN